MIFFPHIYSSYLRLKMNNENFVFEDEEGDERRTITCSHRLPSPIPSPNSPKTHLRDQGDEFQ